jgi:pimeloyl-ACP methyl ester carboxylesterase
VKSGHADWPVDEVVRLAAGHQLCVSDFSPPAVRTIAGPAGALNVFDWGGGGTPALLLHGGALTGRTWDFVALQIRPARRLIAPDLRGHGESHWADDYSLADYVDDVVATLNSLDVKRCHLAGMSLGGVIAALAASRLSGRAVSLALIDVAPGVDFESTRTMRSFMSAIEVAPSIESVVDAALAASANGDRERIGYRMRTLLRRAPSGGWKLREDRRRPHDFPAILEQVNQLDAIANAAGIPVLLVRGARSRILPGASARCFAEAVAMATLLVAPGAGHNVQEDNPAYLAAALADFWGSHDAPMED